MLGFGKKKLAVEQQKQLQKSVSLEVQSHKDLSDKTIEISNRAANKFDQTINNNGFTIRIHAAAGRH
jgi:hypothetical protein